MGFNLGFKGLKDPIVHDRCYKCRQVKSSPHPQTPFLKQPLYSPILVKSPEALPFRKPTKILYAVPVS